LQISEFIAMAVRAIRRIFRRSTLYEICLLIWQELAYYYSIFIQSISRRQRGLDVTFIGRSNGYCSNAG